METWYLNYESQCWYKNTFLINKPQQIARVKGGDKEWNNIDGSGCYFTCLAMIIGVNPAYLSSKLKEVNFFKADRSLPAKNLQGDNVFLVWDGNRPSEASGEVRVNDVFIQNYKRAVDVNIRYVCIREASSVEEAEDIISSERGMGRHIICGYDDHARLVAGNRGGEYFLWDPDLSDTSLEENVNGELSLSWFYREYSNVEEYKNKSAEYWIYEVDMN